jgi:hypothetical protein
MSSEPERTCDCGTFLKRNMAEKYDIEVNASPWRPGMVMPAGFGDFNMRCPHGVQWHMEPTTEQRLQWAKDKVL